MADVIETFRKTVGGLINHDGVYPNLLVYEKEDGSEHVQFVERSDPIVVMCNAFQKIVQEKSKRLVFGMDRYTDPGYGIETRDFVAVYFWENDAWRFGVLEYEDQVLREIRWDHSQWEKWHKRLGDEIRQAMGKFLRVKQHEVSHATKEDPQSSLPPV